MLLTLSNDNVVTWNSINLKSKYWYVIVLYNVCCEYISDLMTNAKSKPNLNQSCQSYCVSCARLQVGMREKGETKQNLPHNPF